MRVNHTQEKNSMKPIAHFEEKYSITLDGKIFSRMNNEFKSTPIGTRGYLIVTLSLNGVKKQFNVHRLVALHYIPNPYGHRIVNHIDGDKTNPDVSNLEWVDDVGNAQHALETGLRSGFLSKDTKLAYLDRVFRGETIRFIASEIGRGEEVLSRMLRVLAKREGREDEWKAEMSRRRKSVAIRNLEKNNFNRA